MPKFNHAFDIAFSLISETEDAEDVTGAMLRAALLKRLEEMPDNELVEACGYPFDTYEED